ncbi:cation/H(+) antiporter 4-like [Euphorbia lathyris]|uniref:cation/H(+) antiporter 4-like n=1 Tax=Euphorbia lathyris TaxID=212925 RepID=UPI003313170C
MEDFAMDFPGLNTTMTCLVMPQKSNSNGIRGGFRSKTHFLTHSLPLLELQIGMILTLSHLIRFFLKPFGVSTFLSCILAGIILGPNGLGKFDSMREIVFPHDSQDIIYVATSLGMNLYVFLIAVKIELGMVLKIGHKPLSIGITSTVIPFTVNCIYNSIPQQGIGSLSFEDNYLIIVVVLTSLPVVADAIDELKLANTELGRLTLASALVSDIGGIAIFIIQVFVFSRSVDITINYTIPVLVFLLVLAFIFRPLIDWVLRYTPEGKSVSTSLIYVIMAITIVSQVYFIVLNQNFVLAPFFIGLAIPSGAPLGTALIEKFGPFTNGVLMHILIPTTFMRADLYLYISNFTNLAKSMIVLFAGLLLKMTGCMIPCMVLKIPINEAVALTLILSYTGVVHLNTASSFRDSGTFREQVYGFAAFYILLNATIVPVMVKKLYDPSQRYNSHNTRNVLSMKPHSELKILTCIYGQDNADSYIKLLDTMNPTKDNPMGIYGLHLVELIGRYVPLLIAHSKLKPISTNTSQKIIYEFNQYEKNNWDTVSVQLYTSLSSFPLMHEDIIHMALEKKTSLVILPLHRRWSVHGFIESQEKGWRNVNSKVLENAPCSVAIFFSRGNLMRQRARQSFVSNISICMIFIGGHDDREALILAKRMMKESEVTLTVVHFLPKGHEEKDESEDHIYDIVLLDEIRQMGTVNGRVFYRSQVVEDGPETILLVRSMANQFDMFILGRRYGVSSPQTSGLSQWIELPELGIIGDLFASKELETRASILVVQQKKKIRHAVN